MAIEAELNLGIQNFLSNLEKAEAAVRQSSSRMKGRAGADGGIFGKLGSGVAGAGTDILGAAGLAGGAVGIGMAIKGTLDYADDISDLTLKLNESAEALQKVDYAAKLAGAGGVDQVGDSMIKLERALGDVENVKAAEALEHLGLTAEALASMSLDQKILALSDAFQKARATGTGVADIQALLGKSSADLIPLLEQGGDALRGMFEDAPVIAEETIQQMAKVNDQIDALIMKTKSWAVNAVGGVVGLGGFFKDFFGEVISGKGLTDAWDAALLAVADRDLADLQAQAGRDEKRQKSGAAKGALVAGAEEAAAAAAAEKDKLSAADKAEEAIVRRRQQAQDENARLLARATEMRFNAMPDQEKLLGLQTRLANTLGVGSVGSRDEVLAGIDKLRASGKGAAAVQALEDFSAIGQLAAREKGARVGGEGQGSFATLMDQVFGRGTPEQQLDEMKAANTNARDQVKTLNEILRKMDMPPPTSTFTNYGL